MLRSDADAPKPPAYPFISINVKEPPADKKRTIRQLPGVSPRALSSDFPDRRLGLAAASNRHRHISVSVRGLLRMLPKSRKRKNTTLASFFSKP
jgi:hypothetical protein